MMTILQHVVFVFPPVDHQSTNMFFIFIVDHFVHSSIMIILQGL